MQKNYIINEKTYYLNESNNDLIVNELGEEHIINDLSEKKVLEQSCLYYGCSLKGRKDGTKNLINEKYKVPVMVNEKKLLTFFSIISRGNTTTVWLSYNNIESYHQISKNKVLINFKNNYSKTFHTSYYVFHHQILKCSRLIVIYNNRNS